MIGKNNPLNIRYSRLNKWKGQTGQRKGFCEFSSMYYGIRAALYLLIVSYSRRGIKTYREIIYAYAPPSENNSDNYLYFVCSGLNVLPSDRPVLFTSYVMLLERMSIMEGNSVKVEMSDFDKLFIEFKKYINYKVK